MRLLVNVTRWVVVAALLALLVLPNALAFIARATPIEVDGLSMSPTYAIGDVVFISPATSADFVKGTVVTVRNKGGDMYTHRIVSVDGDKAQLKGDGNTYEDPTEIKFSDLAGAVRAHVGGLPGQVLNLLFKWPVRISFLVFILGLTFLPLGRSRDIEEPKTDDDDDDSTVVTSPAAIEPVSRKALHSTPKRSARKHPARKHSARKEPS
jgi:signal peptidase I